MYSVEQYSCAMLLHIMHHVKNDGAKYLTKKNLTSTVPCKENIQNSGKILKNKFTAEQRGLYENSCFK